MKVIYRITRYMGYVGALVLFVMMLITVADVFARYVLNNPIGGVTEMSALMLVIVVGLGLGWCALERAHVKVDLITDRLPRKVGFILVNVMLILVLMIYGLMTWYTFSEVMESEQFSSILRISMTPFQWFFWAGLVIFCICILVVIIENFRKGVRDES